MCGLPTQLCGDRFRASAKHSRVPRPAGTHPNVEMLPGYLFHDSAYLPDRMARTSSEIECSESRRVEPVQSQHVSLRYVEYVDIIAQAGAIGSGMFGPINLEKFAPSRRDL